MTAYIVNPTWFNGDLAFDALLEPTDIASASFTEPLAVGARSTALLSFVVAGDVPLDTVSPTFSG